jgi:hypothetical protein
MHGTSLGMSYLIDSKIKGVEIGYNLKVNLLKLGDESTLGIHAFVLNGFYYERFDNTSPKPGYLNMNFMIGPEFSHGAGSSYDSESAVGVGITPLYCFEHQFGISKVFSSYGMMASLRFRLRNPSGLSLFYLHDIETQTPFKIGAKAVLFIHSIFKK